MIDWAAIIKRHNDVVKQTEVNIEEPVVDEGPVLVFDEWVEQSNRKESQWTLTSHNDTWVRLDHKGTWGNEFWEICVKGDVDFYYRSSLQEAQQDVYLKLGYKVYA